VNDIEQATSSVSAHGELLGFNCGDDYPCLYDATPLSSSHYQGFQRLMRVEGTGLDGRYLVVSSSHHSGGDKGPRFAVVHMPSRGDGGGTDERLRSNKLDPAVAYSADAPPPLEDAIVKTVDIPGSEYRPYFEHWHPGGMQAIGQYLLVPVENNESGMACPTYRVVDCAAIFAYDMANPLQPHLVWSFDLNSTGAATVGIAKLMDDTYLMVVGLRDTATLDFYLSSRTDLSSDPLWAYIGQWEGSMLPASAFGGWQGGNGYQALGLVTNVKGQLYLVGSGKDSGVDYVDAFRLDIHPDESPVAIAVTKVASRILHCSSVPFSNIVSVYGGLNCNLDAAAGAYLDANHDFIFYATEHGSHGPTLGPTATTRMKEFRHVPALGSFVCDSMEDAWVELYEHRDFDGRSLMLDHIDNDERNLLDFTQLDEFNDLASSAKWCIPTGARFQIYEHVDHGGGYYDLIGNGSVSGLADFSVVHFFSSGAELNDHVSSGRWDP
jgi:hypothetical protein